MPAQTITSDSIVGRTASADRVAGRTVYGESFEEESLYPASLTNLLGYYPIDNDDGTDFSGNNLHLTDEDCGYGAGKFNRGLFLPGGSQNGSKVLHRQTGTDFSLGSSDFTICVWLNLNNYEVGEKGVIGIAGTVSFQTIGISYLSGVPRAIKNDAVQISGGALNLATWHHLVVRRAGGTLSLWQDGSSLGTAAIAGSLEAAYQPESFGMGSRYNGIGLMFGTLSDAAIWTRALTDNEIGNIWNGGVGRRIKPQ